MDNAFAIVDIETTGGAAYYSKIIEIGIVVVCNGEVTDTFNTLINPCRSIPPFITNLTGISQKMVENAPVFKDVAPHILELTAGKIFVAHSVAFDYSFLKTEFHAIGIGFERKKLCSIKLTRKLVPGLRSYGLAALCKYFEVENKKAHSAMGDAEATAEIFLKLSKIDAFQETVQSLQKRNSKAYLPVNYHENDFDNLPSCAGVYYFHAKNGRVLYVGKANNIKERVKEHLTGNAHTKTHTMMREQIYKITYHVTGNELMALLYENEAIKKHFPKYNRSGKSFKLQYGIFMYEDQNSYMRIVIAESGKYSKPLATFKTKSAALSYVIKKAIEHKLCLKLCNVLEKNEQCSHLGHNQCPNCAYGEHFEAYNERKVQAFVAKAESQNYIIKSDGCYRGQQALVLIQNGKISGYGFMDITDADIDVELIKSSISGYYDTIDAQFIIDTYIKKCTFLFEKNGYKVLEWK